MYSSGRSVTADSRDFGFVWTREALLPVGCGAAVSGQRAGQSVSFGVCFQKKICRLLQFRLETLQNPFFVRFGFKISLVEHDLFHNYVTSEMCSNLFFELPVSFCLLVRKKQQSFFKLRFIFIFPLLW